MRLAKNIKATLCVSLVAFACLSLCLWFWRQSVVHKRSSISNSAIQHGVSAGDFVAARSALFGLADEKVREEKERQIRIAELKQALSVRDTGLLRLAIGDEGKNWIAPDLLEAADLELAREAIQSRDFESYREYSGNWKAKSTNPGQWILLEADHFLARKLPEDALEYLKSAQLQGPQDALRHARIALLEAKEPWKAMASLDRGLMADPRNADVLSFRAQIQEAAGRLADARLDYVAAVFSERKNPLHRDILANFYLRTGDFPAAAETWRDAAEDTGLGVYALKSWFWSRLCGVRLSKPLPPSRQEGWAELISALAATPDDVFWPSSLDSQLASVRGGNNRREVIWLRVLEAIRIKDFTNASAQLETGFPNDAAQLRPGLAIHLLAHLHALSGKDPQVTLAGREIPRIPEDSHPCLLEFNRWAKRSNDENQNQRFNTWLKQPTSIIGTLFSYGWPGAAVIVGKAQNLAPAEEAPEWFDYGYAKSLLIRDGKAPARQWLESLPTRTTAANLLLGEISLTSGSVNQGLDLLQKIASEKSPHASRASWTIALTELDRGNPSKARDVTLADDSLAKSIQGREILARIALAEGNRAETIRIYQELGDQSADAMIFLSKEAFAAGDFAQARKWTGNLARRFPEQPDFRRNLIKIDEAEKLKSP